MDFKWDRLRKLIRDFGRVYAARSAALVRKGVCSLKSADHKTGKMPVLPKLEPNPCS